jgi:two-component system nitrate/nitrite response regulator NarL
MGEDDRVRVLLVDDDAMVARGLALALEHTEQVEVVMTTATLEEGMAIAKEYRPEVVVVDGELDGRMVERFIEAVRTFDAKIGVVVLTHRADATRVARSIASGAAAVVQKSDELQRLVHAVKASRRGQIVVEREVLQAALRAPASQAADLLTRREHEVLELLDSGLSTPQLAQTLSIAKNTARNYVQSLLVKLGAHSRVEALSIARDRGLLARR